jgi:uncharacterized protein (TIGR02996 family)
VTDDEAFIRAIVDRPGEDLPRLAYADWLDEHDDPRGAYLRAERAAVLAGGAAGLRERAAGLDPVWVARVSRPPVGVCCDRVCFDESGPRLTAADIDRVQAALSCHFPAEYRAFLLNHNGGRPTPSDTPETIDHLNVNLNRFYSISATAMPSDTTIESAVVRYREWLPEWLSRAADETERADLDSFPHFIPIARLTSNIFELVIGPDGGPRDGQLVMVDWTVGPPPIGYYNIPNTLPTLLAQLTTT